MRLRTALYSGLVILFLCFLEKLWESFPNRFRPLVNLIKSIYIFFGHDLLYN